MTYHIYANGKLVGEIKRGSKSSFSVQPGKVVIQLRYGYSLSNELALDVSKGESIFLESGTLDPLAMERLDLYLRRITDQFAIIHIKRVPNPLFGSSIYLIYVNGEKFSSLIDSEFAFSVQPGKAVIQLKSIWVWAG